MIPVFLCCVFLVSTMASSLSKNAEGLVRLESDAVQPDGSLFHLTKESDPKCQFMKDTTDAVDGSTTVVLMDFEKGQSVMLESTDPDVCYVRDISEEDMKNRAENCKDGLVLNKVGETAREAKAYENGDELSEADLSPRLAAYCKGRLLVALKEAAPLKEAGQTGGAVQRRACREVVDRFCKPVCVDRCVGRFLLVFHCIEWKETCTDSCSLVKRLVCN